MAVQKLTGQYPTLFTHKYRVSWDDFTTVNTVVKKVTLFTNQPVYDLVYFKVIPRVAMGGTTATNLRMNLKPAGFEGTVYNNDGIFMEWDGKQAPSSIAGRAKASDGFTNGGANAVPWQTFAWGVNVVMYAQGGGVLTGLNAGEFDIWVTTMRQS